MKKSRAITPLFVIAAAYDGILGLAFLIAAPALFEWAGVTPPNHFGYVHFPAALLIIFALMFAEKHNVGRKEAAWSMYESFAALLGAESIESKYIAIVMSSPLGRLFRIALLFLVLIVTATYTANLAAFLSAPTTVLHGPAPDGGGGGARLGPRPGPGRGPPIHAMRDRASRYDRPRGRESADLDGLGAALGPESLVARLGEELLGGLLRVVAPALVLEEHRAVATRRDGADRLTPEIVCPPR